MAVVSVISRRYALLVPLALLAFILLILTAGPAGAQSTVDYDADDDRLIEIGNLAQLNALRHDLNANGLQDAVAAPDWAIYTAAFPRAAAGMGCPPDDGCNGYELIRDLNFDTNGDGVVDGDDPGSYPNWDPIGQSGVGWIGRFHGNGHIIANLTITSSAVWHVGLFGFAPLSTITNLGVTDVNINLTSNTVSYRVAAVNAGAISTTLRYVYATGRISVTGDAGRTHEVGGLVGFLSDGGLYASWSDIDINAAGGTIRVGGLGCYFLGSSTVRGVYALGAVTARGVTATSSVWGGGLFGGGQGGGTTISAAYANNPVSVSRTGAPGGLSGGVFAPDASFAGNVSGQVYWNVQTSGISDGDLTDSVIGRRTRELRRPTDYAGLYAGWNVDVDGDSTPDDPWDFGGPRDYPLLQADFNGDGRATWQEFGPQYRYIPSPPPYNPAHDHPEIYHNPRYEMATSCEVRTTGEGDEAVSTSTLTFDLGDYTRPLTLALSLWDGDVFRSLQSQGIAMPELQQTGQTATVEVVTDPAQTRFRLDSEYGLNLVLGYADCHTDDPEE